MLEPWLARAKEATATLERALARAQLVQSGLDDLVCALGAGDRRARVDPATRALYREVPRG